MTTVAIASSTQLAADGGAAVARTGGNAVDCAIAASLVSVVTEPGICSIGSGGFLTISAPGEEPVTIDGYVTMPGQDLPADYSADGSVYVHMDYGGGVDLVVGHASVATPGSLAACGVASRRFGSLPWAALFEPAHGHARDGFPLQNVSHNYLRCSQEAVFNWNEDGFAAIHDSEGNLLRPGDPVHVPYLADSIELIAREGPEAFYSGSLAALIEQDSLANGGYLTRADLESFEAVVRDPIVAEGDAWSVYTNPPPAVGGATLAAMLLLMQGRPAEGWTMEELGHWVKVQRAVLGFRRNRLDMSTDISRDVEALLTAARHGELGDYKSSPSTVHTSAVDSNGLACAVTLSAGYGSGVMPPGTGIWMNNCLGELELNRRGADWPVGVRLPSNMAPTVARREDGSVLAIGSAGSSRITTAIVQSLSNYMNAGMSLGEAVAHPRVHLEEAESGWQVAYEPGMPADELDVPSRAFDDLNMFFGGAGVALWTPENGFEVAADPRRGGGTVIAST
ncbi:MAG: gamma-glutamyltransferase [Gemmatimonadota bacterium]